MKITIKCTTVSWDESEKLARILSHKILESGYKPDILIGIARGGLVPARMVCDFLLHNEVLSIRTEHWTTASKLEKARIKFSLPEEADIFGKKILVVDDVADTGDSFSVILEYLKEKKPDEIRTAALHYKITSHIVPDYWGEKLEEWNWIIYPWAYYEDLSGFVEKLLDKPLTEDEIRKYLKNDYNIAISGEELMEILDDFSRLGKLKKSEKDKKIMWEKADS